MGNWYDGIGSTIGNGIGGAFDFLSGTPQGTTARGAAAAGTAVQQSPTAQSAGKATGLSDWMKMLGIGPSAAPAEDRMAKPSELADLADGRLPPTAGGDRSFSNGVQGNTGSNGLERQPDGTWKAPSVNNWRATGTSGGNRQSDIDARDEQVKVGAPEIYQPDLSKIPRTTTGQLGLEDLGKNGVAKDANINGAGHFTSTAWGTNNDPLSFGAKTKIDPLTGKGMTSFMSGGGQAGGEYKNGYRAVAASKDGRHTAQAEGGFVASGGASYGVGLDTANGLNAQAGVGGKVGLYGNADANTKTGSVNIGGVDYDAGAGVHGEAFVGAKAGAGGQIGLGPNFIGAKGSAGAFVGAEAAGDIHANLGPVGGKVGGSLMAGAGAGIDGDISFQDGKFHMGGKMFAALGYGGSLGGEITVDVARWASRSRTSRRRRGPASRTARRRSTTARATSPRRRAAACRTRVEGSRTPAARSTTAPRTCSRGSDRRALRTGVSARCDEARPSDSHQLGAAGHRRGADDPVPEHGVRDARHADRAGPPRSGPVGPAGVPLSRAA